MMLASKPLTIRSIVQSAHAIASVSATVSPEQYSYT